MWLLRSCAPRGDPRLAFIDTVGNDAPLAYTAHGHAIQRLRYMTRAGGNRSGFDAQADAPESLRTGVRLRPVVPEDYATLYGLATVGQLALPSVATPSPEDFVRELWTDVHTQLVVEGQAGPVSLCVARRASLAHGFTYVTETPLVEGVLEARAAGFWEFLHFLFATWNLRKVYCEVLEKDLDEFIALGGARFAQEGVLTAHDARSGQEYDRYIFAIRRDWL